MWIWRCDNSTDLGISSDYYADEGGGEEEEAHEESADTHGQLFEFAGCDGCETCEVIRLSDFVVLCCSCGRGATGGLSGGAEGAG